MLWLGKEMLDLYPDGVTCVDCAMVKLDKALEPDTIAKKFVLMAARWSSAPNCSKMR